MRLQLCLKFVGQPRIIKAIIVSAPSLQMGLYTHMSIYPIRLSQPSHAPSTQIPIGPRHQPQRQPNKTRPWSTPNLPQAALHAQTYSLTLILSSVSQRILNPICDDSRGSWSSDVSGRAVLLRGAAERGPPWRCGRPADSPPSGG